MAAIISVEEYERILKQCAKDFRVLDEIWVANKGLSPKVVKRDVAAAIREVRGNKKKHHAKSRS